MMESTGARNCPRCGAQVDPDALFCPLDGTPITGSSESAAPAPLFISPNRIIFMSLLSFGLYLVYWLYKTWKHYRDHTGEQAYPIWHALTFFVPIYGSFRAHSHFRTFGELASRAGLDIRISPGIAFAVILAGWFFFTAIGSVSSPEFVAVVDPVTGEQAVDPETGAAQFEVIEPTRSELITALFLRLINVGLGIWMILHAQPRLNYYWNNAYGARLIGMGLGKGEILVLVIGAFAWFGTISGIMSA